MTPDYEKMTGASSSGGAEVNAAGGVVWRAGDAGVEYAIIHRPRHDDWSLPKGKLDPGETWEQAAAREVEEEIGVRCALGDELPPVSYRDDRGRAKLVRYWLMEVVEAPDFAPNDEVDEVRWMPAAAARAALTYPHDRDLLAAAAAALTRRAAR